MQAFDITQFEPYLFLLIGLSGVLLSLKKNRLVVLKNTGEKVEGIIFKLEQSTNSQLIYENTSSVMNKVTVRFVTKKDEWITSELKEPFSLFFTGQYKPGDKIDVYYDPEKSTSFYVDTRQSDVVARILIAVAGLAFCLIGLYQLSA